MSFPPALSPSLHILPVSLFSSVAFKLVSYGNILNMRERFTNIERWSWHSRGPLLQKLCCGGRSGTVSQMESGYMLKTFSATCQELVQLTGQPVPGLGWKAWMGHISWEEMTFRPWKSYNKTEHRRRLVRGLQILGKCEAVKCAVLFA